MSSILRSTSILTHYADDRTLTRVHGDDRDDKSTENMAREMEENSKVSHPRSTDTSRQQRTDVFRPVSRQHSRADPGHERRAVCAVADTSAAVNLGSRPAHPGPSSAHTETT